LECWFIIKNGPLAIITKDSEGNVVEKEEKDYTAADNLKAQKNSMAMHILQSGVSKTEYGRISACQTAKEIWDCLEVAYEGTVQVKKH
jgi:hypothetical protein